VEILSAIVGLFGGALNYLGVDRQASAAERIARERTEAARAWYDALVEGWLSQERINEIRAWFGRDVAWEEGDVQRARILIVALAGAGLLALALYLAAKEEA